MKPLVSILIPAYNDEAWVADTIRSAMAQTWPRKEILIVDDGSTDQTMEVARRFASKVVKVVSKEHQGAPATRNYALQLSQGDYIQWLDADDLLAPDKIERQLAALQDVPSKRVLLSSSWAYFYYRTRRARLVPTSLWQDLSPREWLLRKMGENLFMPNFNWLTSRELTEAAGPQDTRLHFNQDGEYFCRVLLASEGVRFVPEARAFYRFTTSNRVSQLENGKKKESLLLSMKLHIQYLRSLEESERVRKACLAYLQSWYIHFYPDHPDFVTEMQAMAAQLQGRLEAPCLRRKYAWIKPLFGWQAAKWAQMALPLLRIRGARLWDKTMYRWETRDAARHPTSDATPAGYTFQRLR